MKGTYESATWKKYFVYVARIVHSPLSIGRRRGNVREIVIVRRNIIERGRWTPVNCVRRRRTASGAKRMIGFSFEFILEHFVCVRARACVCVFSWDRDLGGKGLRAPMILRAMASGVLYSW